MVSRDDDAMCVLKHPELFSSDAMRTMLMSPMAAGGDDPRFLDRMGVLAEALPCGLDELIHIRNLLAGNPMVDVPGIVPGIPGIHAGHVAGSERSALLYTMLVLYHPPMR